MAKDKKEKTEMVEEKAPVEEPVPEPKPKETKGTVIYTANGKMLKMPDGTLVVYKD